jgi:Type I phosphodiesterase / nucleotide pyrophosphatase
MVWDGLRPDMVTREWTPNLVGMENAGVRFAHHHSVFPTVTMVNAASIAAGAYPGGTTIVGDEQYLRPRASGMKIELPPGEQWATQPVDLEDSLLLAKLNGPAIFNGHLLGIETLAQQIRRAGGYVAIIGKRGPTFLFDDSVTGDSANGGAIANSDYTFISDDMAAPASLNGKLRPAPPILATNQVPSAARDAHFARIVAERALPAAKAAAMEGRPALIVFWQHNPDLVQHRCGLGTQADLDSLRACDGNLAEVRKAIASLGIADGTDLMVLSDHGFATIRAAVPLAQLLVAAGLKKSPTSDDVVVAPNGGTDLVYISRAAYPTVESRRALLQRMADFADSQPWVGPMFTRGAGEKESGERSAKDNSSPRHSASGSGSVSLGWIKGTFSFDDVALGGADAGAPDLVISLRELPEAGNRGLTGPGNAAYVFDADREKRADANRSQPLVTPVAGVVYSDAGQHFTTGLGMHGAAGVRELHNFCAVVGPDFRHHFVDELPTGNIDVRATIARAIGLHPGYKNKAASGLAPAGRPLDEAITGPHPATSVGESRITASRRLAEMETKTTLSFTELRLGNARFRYLDDAEVVQAPVKKSK